MNEQSETLYVDLKKTREQLDSISFAENAPTIFAGTQEMAIYLLDEYLRGNKRTLCSREAIDKLLQISCDYRHQAQELVLRKMNGRDPRCCEAIAETENLMRRAVDFICALAVADTPWTKND